MAKVDWKSTKEILLVALLGTVLFFVSTFCAYEILNNCSACTTQEKEKENNIPTHSTALSVLDSTSVNQKNNHAR